MSGTTIVAAALMAAACWTAIGPGPRRLPVGAEWPARPRGQPASGTAAVDRGQAMPAAVVAELVASLIAAGLPPSRAVDVVTRSLRDLQVPAEPPGELLDAIDLAQRTGLAPVGLVRAAAAEQRRRQATADSVAARRLGVLVVIPMGVCLLPAFVLLTIAPLVLALLGEVLAT